MAPIPPGMDPSSHLEGPKLAFLASTLSSSYFIPCAET